MTITIALILCLIALLVTLFLIDRNVYKTTKRQLERTEKIVENQEKVITSLKNEVGFLEETVVLQKKMIVNYKTIEDLSKSQIEILQNYIQRKDELSEEHRQRITDLLTKAFDGNEFTYAIAEVLYDFEVRSNTTLGNIAKEIVMVLRNKILGE